MFVSRNDLRISMKCNDNETQFPIELLNLWEMTELETTKKNKPYLDKNFSDPERDFSTAGIILFKFEK